MSRKPLFFHPVIPTITADGMATLYRNHIWKRFVFPVNLSRIAVLSSPPPLPNDLCSLLNIDQALSIAYHPQSDGQQNGLIKARTVSPHLPSIRKNDWASHLSYAEFAHNHPPSTPRLLQSPFYALMGYYPRSLPLDIPASSIPDGPDTPGLLIYRFAWIFFCRPNPRPPILAHFVIPCAPIASAIRLWLEGKNISTSLPP